MTTREALTSLADQGVSLTYWKLRGLIERNEVPRPRLNSSLAWDWSPADIAAVVRFVRQRAEAEVARG